MPILIHIVPLIINVVMMLIFVASVLSWFPHDARNPLVRALHAVVDPILHPIRTILPPMGGMDLSPLVAMVILILLKRLLQPGLY